MSSRMTSCSFGENQMYAVTFSHQAGRILANNNGLCSDRQRRQKLVTNRKIHAGTTVYSMPPLCITVYTPINKPLCCQPLYWLLLQSRQSARDFRCGGCQRVSYCGQQCQHTHWTRYHRAECRNRQNCWIFPRLTKSKKQSSSTGLDSDGPGSWFERRAGRVSWYWATSPLRKMAVDCKLPKWQLLQARGISPLAAGHRKDFPKGLLARYQLLASDIVANADTNELLGKDLPGTAYH